MSKNQEIAFPAKKTEENILISIIIPDSFNSLHPKNHE
jgi:hypothetical protein